MPRPLITLLTDFGLNDHYVAAMKGVVLGIAPDTTLVDISHLIEPYAIGEGAYELTQAWKHFPNGTVHLVVVDPGVGSDRRPVAAAAGGHYFVGPDNGVLTMALREVADVDVRQITAEHLFRSPVSSTFHGRDIFAPVAAHLAAGLRFEEVGPPIHDCIQLQGLDPEQTEPNSWSGRILHVDRFGNAVTNFRTGRFEWIRESVNTFEMGMGKERVNTFQRRYSSAKAGEIFLLSGSGGFLEVASNQQSAAATLNLKSGDPITLRRL